MMCLRFPPLWKQYRSVPLFLLVIVLLVGTGCGKVKRATVSGKVTFNGRPVIGTVSFIDAKNHTGSAQTNEKGEYTVKDAPVGEVTVTVNVPDIPRMMGGGVGMPKPPPGMSQMKPPPGMEPAAGGTAKVDPSRIVPIPDKYKTVDKSPLKFKVENGTQEYDIKITP